MKYIIMGILLTAMSMYGTVQVTTYDVKDSSKQIVHAKGKSIDDIKRALSKINCVSSDTKFSPVWNDVEYQDEYETVVLCANLQFHNACERTYEHDDFTKVVSVLCL